VRRPDPLTTWSLVACLLLAGLALGVLEQPYQWLSDLGFEMQRMLATGSDRPVDLRVALIPLAGTAIMCLLAWGPLRAGKGGGVTGIMVLQRPDQDSAIEEAALKTLSVRAQFQRAILMIFTRGAGLTVGTESPSTALGATTLLWLRERLRPLQALPVPLTSAIGGGAGLGAAFRSPLMGVTYALEELSASKGLSLVLPCALVGGLGALTHSGLGIPAHGLDMPSVGLRPELWPRALALTLVASLTGALFVKTVQAAVRHAKRLFAWSVLAGALAGGLALAVLAVVSGGVSLNDGQLTLVPLLTGDGGVSATQAAARFLASVVSVALGAPGGVMHDTMVLGACLSELAALGLGSADQAALAAIGAVAFFSAATGTPMFCAIFVFQLQGDPTMLTPMFLFSALACVVGKKLNPVSWNESQVEAFVAAAKPG
jgi:chloride channel protein, CIC family